MITTNHAAQDIFSIVPIDILADKRLTLRHIKVLIALLSFRSKNTDTVWPSRSALSERCGYPESRISAVTTELVALGWLKKVGDGGRGMSTEYRVMVPETVTDLGTVSPAETVTGLVTVTETETVTDLVTKRLPIWEPPKNSFEQTMNRQINSLRSFGAREDDAATKTHTKRPPKPRPKPTFDPASIDLPGYLPHDAWLEFCEHRKIIKRPISELAAKKLVQTIERLHADGENIIKCIDQSIERGYTGIFGARHAQQHTKHYSGRNGQGIDWHNTDW